MPLDTHATLVRDWVTKHSEAISYALHVARTQIAADVKAMRASPDDSKERELLQTFEGYLERLDAAIDDCPIE